ncbi:MAG: hypothetical protein AAB316_18275 [Bacteroidota bacterium]
MEDSLAGVVCYSGFNVKAQSASSFTPMAKATLATVRYFPRTRIPTQRFGKGDEVAAQNE